MCSTSNDKKHVKLCPDRSLFTFLFPIYFHYGSLTKSNSPVVLFLVTKHRNSSSACLRPPRAILSNVDGVVKEPSGEVVVGGGSVVEVLSGFVVVSEVVDPVVVVVESAVVGSAGVEGVVEDGGSVGVVVDIVVVVVEAVVEAAEVLGPFGVVVLGATVVSSLGYKLSSLHSSFLYAA